MFLTIGIIIIYVGFLICAIKSMIIKKKIDWVKVM